MPSHEGWITKQGHKRQNWRRRYAVYEPESGILAYYEKPQHKGQAPKGQISVAHYETQKMNTGRM